MGALPNEERAEVLKALLRHWNVHDTAHLHTLLPAYVGERVRLTENISADHRLVQEAEGTVVHIVLDPEECIEAVRGEVALKYCPVGIWVCFDDCKDTPPANELYDKIEPCARGALCHQDGYAGGSSYPPPGGVAMPRIFPAARLCSVMREPPDVQTQARIEMMTHCAGGTVGQHGDRARCVRAYKHR